MENLEIKCLGLKYGDVTVAAGYELKGLIYTIKEFEEIVRTLNDEGFYYSNVNFEYEGYQYTVAQVFRYGESLIDLYEVDYNITDDIWNKLYNDLTPMEDLGIAEDLQVQVFKRVDIYENLLSEPEPEPEPETKPEVKRDESWFEDVTNVLSKDELKKYGDLDDLSDDAYDQLREEYQSKVSYSRLISEDHYKLPDILSTYQTIYNDTFVNASAVGDEHNIRTVKHREGIRAVVKSMMEIPRPVLRGVTGSGDNENYDYTYKHLEPFLSKVLSVNNSPNTSWMSETSLVFTTIQEQIMDEIVKLYGSSQGFIDEYVNMGNGDSILHPISVPIGSDIIEIHTVKMVSDERGAKIDFIRERNGEEIRAPYPLMILCLRFEDPKLIYTGLNNMQELYYNDLGITINPEEMDFDFKEVDIYNLKYLGKAEDEQDVHLFETEDNKYMLIASNNIGNMLLGSRYILNGDNFNIYYEGNLIEIYPKGKTLTSEEVINLYTSASSEYDETGNLTKIVSPYPEYNEYTGFSYKNEITNLNHLNIIENYNKLLEENIPVMNNLDDGIDIKRPRPTEDDGIDIKRPRPTEDDGIDIERPRIKSIPEVDDVDGVVDLFSEQSQPQAQQEVTISADPSPYTAPEGVEGNIAQAYYMMIGSLNQDKLGLFKTEFKELINKYKK